MYYAVLREVNRAIDDDRIIIGNSTRDVKRNILTSRIYYIMKSKIYQIKEPYEWL